MVILQTKKVVDKPHAGFLDSEPSLSAVGAVGTKYPEMVLLPPSF